jgi:hypothetical protein
MVLRAVFLTVVVMLLIVVAIAYACKPLILRALKSIRAMDERDEAVARAMEEAKRCEEIEIERARKAALDELDREAHQPNFCSEGSSGKDENLS